ncbi:MAG: hypothetical protein E6J03_09265 [Chloroflexi bacterium]|nr:MAG: hypothetical protein E6J03_09265 [Chloroflexota bacterium]
MQLSRHRPAVGDGAGVGEPVELPETGLGVHSRLRPSSPQLLADAEGVGVATGADGLDGEPVELVEVVVVVVLGFTVGEAPAFGVGVEQLPTRPSTGIATSVVPGWQSAGSSWQAACGMEMPWPADCWSPFPPRPSEPRPRPPRSPGPRVAA